MYTAKIVDFEFWSFPVLKLLGNGCTLAVQCAEQTLPILCESFPEAVALL